MDVLAAHRMLDPHSDPQGHRQESDNTMTTTVQSTTANGVDVDALFGTINVVKGQPELAQFRFRSTNTWVAGTHSRTTMGSFSGAGAEHEHRATYAYDADHPAVLVGADNGPTPVEFLMHAIASCLTAGIANIASARGVELRSVSSTVEGDIDLQGILGLSDEVRNGYQGIRVHFEIDSPATAEAVEAVVAQSQARSAVFDVLTNGTKVDVSVKA
jgi:uncharacterized OsmC-like protein